MSGICFYHVFGWPIFVDIAVYMTKNPNTAFVVVCYIYPAFYVPGKMALFLTLQMIAFSIEDTVKWAYRKGGYDFLSQRLLRLVGYTWVAAWWLATWPILLFPLARGILPLIKG
ncbi:hypothetical protein BJX70DRAFT_378204 [Aspergillus crustosus]